MFVCAQAIRELAGPKQLQARLSCKQAVCTQLRAQLASAQQHIAALQAQQQPCPPAAQEQEQQQQQLCLTEPASLQEQLDAAHKQVQMLQDSSLADAAALADELHLSQQQVAELQEQLHQQQAQAAAQQAHLCAAQQAATHLRQQLAASQGQHADLQAQLCAAQQEVSSLQQQLTASQDRPAALQQQLQAAQAQVQELQDRQQELVHQSAADQKQLSKATKRAKALQDQLSAQEAATHSQLQSSQQRVKALQEQLHFAQAQLSAARAQAAAQQQQQQQLMLPSSQAAAPASLQYPQLAAACSLVSELQAWLLATQMELERERDRLLIAQVLTRDAQSRQHMQQVLSKAATDLAKVAYVQQQHHKLQHQLQSVAASSAPEPSRSLRLTSSACASETSAERDGQLAALQQEKTDLQGQLQAAQAQLAPLQQQLQLAQDQSQALQGTSRLHACSLLCCLSSDHNKILDIMLCEEASHAPLGVCVLAQALVALSAPGLAIQADQCNRPGLCIAEAVSSLQPCSIHLQQSAASVQAAAAGHCCYLKTGSPHHKAQADSNN